jgi:sugar phosphate isomerase/epimerase
MNPIGLECLSMFGLHPVDFIRIAGELGCSHVTLSMSSSPNRLPIYPDIAFRQDPALRRDMRSALADNAVKIGMMEGFAVLPGGSVDDFAADLDMTAELGTRAICTVSIDKDAARTHDQYARLAELAAQRGLLTTTEACAGVYRKLDLALEAARAVAHPSFSLLIDTMHFFRSGSTVADLAAIDPVLIGHVQLCDVPMPAEMDSYMEEALYERRCPGDGDLPLAEFLAQVPVGVIVGLEIPIRSEAEAGIGPRERMARCVAATRQLMDRQPSLLSSP